MGRIGKRVAICEAIRSGEYTDHKDLVSLVGEAEAILDGVEYRTAVEQALAMREIKGK